MLARAIGRRLLSSSARGESGVQLFDSVSGGQLSLTTVLNGGASLTWYTCGPTVYDKAHLGHARAYLVVDLIQRLVQFTTRTPVQHLLGMTDIDDKILAAAAAAGVPPLELARRYERDFHADMAALGVRPPAGVARVSEHIAEIVDYARRIEANGYAYVGRTSGSLYFDTDAFESRLCRYERLVPRGGNLSSPTPAATADEKRSPRDFVLWKARDASSDDASCLWPSPWGLGRPGWHIECSTMCQTHFGRELDVHAGGVDLCFPHHANEIAQALAYHDDASLAWPRCFLHVGHLYIEGRKMSKSLKNYTSIGEFLAAHRPDEFRLFCLLSHYRSRVDFASDRMLEAANIIAKYTGFHRRLLTTDSTHNDDKNRCGRWAPGDSALLTHLVRTQNAIDASLRDDFDTPRAVRLLFELVAAVHSYLDGAARPNTYLLRSVQDYVADVWSNAFGFAPDHEPAKKSNGDGDVARHLEKLQLIRDQLRTVAKSAPADCKQPLFDLSDRIRDDVLLPCGATIGDRKIK